MTVRYDALRNSLYFADDFSLEQRQKLVVIGYLFVDDTRLELLAQGFEKIPAKQTRPQTLKHQWSYAALLAILTK